MWRMVTYQCNTLSETFLRFWARLSSLRGWLRYGAWARMQAFRAKCCIPFQGSFSRRNYVVETVPLIAAQTSQISF